MSPIVAPDISELDSGNNYSLSLFGDNFEVSKEDLERLSDEIKELKEETGKSWEPPQPSSDSKVWRYLNFTQLLSILERDAMWFSSISKFNDPYEGTIPQQNLEDEIDQLAESADVDRDIAEKFHNFVTSQSRYSSGAFVNCWNINEYESAALWEQYIDSTEGVAICTTVDSLERSISESDKNPIFGKIEYINYERDKIQHGKLPALYHKRKSFEHEKEFRISVVDSEEKENNDKGIYVNVDVDELIDKIYLAPTTQDWFHNQVQMVLDTYDVNCELKRSDVYSDPVF